MPPIPRKRSTDVFQVTLKTQIGNWQTYFYILRNCFTGLDGRMRFVLDDNLLGGGLRSVGVYLSVNLAKVD